MLAITALHSSSHTVCPTPYSFHLIFLIASALVCEANVARHKPTPSCPDLPEVSWWKTNHDKIVDYVEQRYKGEWEPYLNKWRDYKNKMRAIYDKNGTAIVKSRGIRLRGASLKKHIGDVEKRILVTQCLQEKHGGRRAASNQVDDYPISDAGRALAGVLRAATQ